MCKEELFLELLLGFPEGVPEATYFFYITHIRDTIRTIYDTYVTSGSLCQKDIRTVNRRSHTLPEIILSNFFMY